MMAAEGVRIPITLVDNVSQSLGGIEGKFNSFSNTIKKVGIAIGAAFSVRAIWNFGKDLVNSYSESEAAVAKFTAALRASGSTMAISTAAITDLAKELQTYTTFSDEATMGAATMLHQLAGLTEDGLKRALPVVQDLASAMGWDLETAATNVAKAIQGNTQMFGRYGIEIAKSDDATQMFNNTMEALESRFGGVARAMGETTAGSLERWKNALDELKEVGGEFIAKFLTPAVEWLTTLVQKLTEALDRSKAFSDAVGGQAGKSVAELKKQLEAVNTMQTWMMKDFGAKSSIFSGEYWKGLTAQTKLMFSGAVGFFDSADTQMDKLADLRTSILAELKAAEAREKAAAKAKPTGPVAATGGGGGTAGKPAEPQGWLWGPSSGYLAPAAESGAMRGARRAEELDEALAASYDRWLASFPRDVSQIIIDQLEGGMGVNIAWPEGVVPVNVENKVMPPSPEEMAPQTATGGGPGGWAITDLLIPLREAFGTIVDIVGPMVSGLGSVVSLMNPLQTIFKAMMDVLGPLIDNLLAPLVGILTVIGQALAAFIAPLLQLLAPVIKWIAEAFVWLYNNALVPLVNGFLKVVYAIGALGTAIFYLITFQWGKLKSIQWSPPAGAGLKPITVGTLTEAGTSTINQTETSASSTGGNWTQGRQLTFNITINAQVVAGDPGLRNLALMIRDEIRAAEAIGY